VDESEIALSDQRQHRNGGFIRVNSGRNDLDDGEDGIEMEDLQPAHSLQMHQQAQQRRRGESELDAPNDGCFG
jgi:hypothetical protein